MRGRTVRVTLWQPAEKVPEASFWQEAVLLGPSHLLEVSPANKDRDADSDGSSRTPGARVQHGPCPA